ncbi:Hypothetical protein BRZCDTV_53 [Brazilian cedratvirus IHUMI]|uniref:Uncharacterized protein n=1 Tax=Brazilian cedratvirus IHUMI TaxID=2126980 RepID=A0A2R8FD30_9VIRU|nr:Hypothetical protein BRZCDTV_53 [Brazilian cedratvirus IHUMI]
MQTITGQINEANWENFADLSGRYAYGYFRRCQAKNRPKLVTPENITHRVFHIEGEDEREFLVCPTAYPELCLNKYGEPFCTKFPKQDARVKCYRSYITPTGCVVLVPEGPSTGQFVTIPETVTSTTKLIVVK